VHFSLCAPALCWQIWCGLAVGLSCEALFMPVPPSTHPIAFGRGAADVFSSSRGNKLRTSSCVNCRLNVLLHDVVTAAGAVHVVTLCCTACWRLRAPDPVCCTLSLCEVQPGCGCGERPFSKSTDCAQGGELHRDHATRCCSGGGYDGGGGGYEGTYTTLRLDPDVWMAHRVLAVVCAHAWYVCVFGPA
jgi:hypothetical protein